MYIYIWLQGRVNNRVLTISVCVCVYVCVCVCVCVTESVCVRARARARAATLRNIAFSACVREVVIISGRRGQNRSDCPVRAIVLGCCGGECYSVVVVFSMGGAPPPTSPLYRVSACVWRILFLCRSAKPGSG